MNKEKWLELLEAYKLVEKGTVKKLEVEDCKCYQVGNIVRIDIKMGTKKGDK